MPTFIYKSIIGFFGSVLVGCANLAPLDFQAGTPEAVVISKLGTPTHVIQAGEGNGRILEYMSGPYGQTTYFARIDGSGKLISYKQVLTTQTFSEIKVGSATKTDVIHTIGTPSETSYLDLPHLEVWSYPYKENPVSDSIMYVHFDSAGVVRKMLNGPDLRRDRYNWLDR
jgi:hypothetical protein